jgi:hypothetical protein
MHLMTGLRWNNLLSEPAMGACQKQKGAAIGAPHPEHIGMFPGSSVVEQLTVNQLVGGSNPSRGAIFQLDFWVRARVF